MGIFFTWIILSFIVGFIGSDRKIGFGGAFFISLIFSPLIGLIFTLISKTKEEEKYRERVLESQRSQQESLERLSKSEPNLKNSIADEIEKLQKLKNNNSITEEEFVKLKNKIIDSEIDYDDKIYDVIENNEEITTINNSTKNYPNYEAIYKFKNSNFFKVVLIIIGIISVVLIIEHFINNSIDTSSHTQTNEIVIENNSDKIENLYKSEKKKLINFTYEDVARYTMATVMGQPSSIIKAYKKEDLYYVSYVRKSDSQKFDYKVKFVGNQILWAGIEKGQRWRDSEYDEKISFAEKEGKLNIITTYGDGSEGIEEFKKGD